MIVIYNKSIVFLLSAHVFHFFGCFGLFFGDTSPTNRPYKIQSNNFGSEPYLSAPPINNNPHLLDPNHDGGEHQSRPKPILISSYLYAKS